MQRSVSQPIRYVNGLCGWISSSPWFQPCRQRQTMSTPSLCTSLSCIWQRSSDSVGALLSGTLKTRRRVEVRRTGAHVQNHTADAGIIRPIVGGSARNSSAAPPLCSSCRSAVLLPVCATCACILTASTGVSTTELKAPATAPANICAPCESSHLSAVPIEYPK